MRMRHRVNEPVRVQHANLEEVAIFAVVVVFFYHLIVHFLSHNNIVPKTQKIVGKNLQNR